MKKLIFGILASTLIIPNLQATLVFSETFNYSDGGIVSNSAGIWVQNTGTAGSMLVSNQQLVVNTSRSEDISASLGATFETNGATAALYASFTLRATGRPTSGGTYLAHFTGPNQFGLLSGHRARVWASVTNVAALAPADNDKFLLSIVNTSGGNAINSQWATQLSTNVTYTVVVKYEIATLTATMWIDPTAESDPSISGTDFPVDLFDTSSGLVNVTDFGFRQATGCGTMWIDNLKIGTTFADVAGANTSPLISAIPDQKTAMNAALVPIAFTVQDAETTAASLIVSNATSNPGLVPLGNIVLGGGGTNRTITITPATGQQGSALITVYVSDGVNTSSTSFTVIVGAPSISLIPNQISTVNTPTPAIPFVAYDAEGDTLTLGASHTNLSLIDTVVVSGVGSNRTVTVTPLSSQTGTATVSITANDGFNTVTQSFVVVFSPLLGVIFSEDFSYADGPLYGNGPWSLSSGTPFEMLVTNGTVQISRLNSEDLNSGTGFGGGAPFAASSGVVLYSGFLLNCEQLPTTAGNYFAHFKDTGSNFRARIFVSTANAEPGYYRVGIANTGATVSSQVPNDLATNTTYLVVSRYNSGTGESAVWVNPVSVASGGAVATDTATTITVAQYGLRQDSNMGVLYLDNLKVGTSLADVATIPPLNQTLTKIVLNGELVLSWGSSLFALQSAPEVTGPWLTIPGATSPYTNAPSENQKYFRLKY